MRLIVSMLVVLCALNACKCEKDITLETHAYLSQSSGKGTLRLVLNNEVKGVLPYHNGNLSCGDSALENRTLTFSLKSGKYTVSVIDSVGTILHQSQFNFTEHSMQGSSTMGGQYSVKSDGCLMLGLTTATSTNE